MGRGLASASCCKDSRGAHPPQRFLVQKVSHLLSSSNFGEAGDGVVLALEMGTLIIPEGRRFPREPQGGCGAGVYQSYQVHISRGRCPQGLPREAMPCGLCSLLQTVTEFPGPGTGASLTPSSVSPSCSWLTLPWDFDIETTVGWHRPKNCFPKPEPRCCLHPGGA